MLRFEAHREINDVLAMQCTHVPNKLQSVTSHHSEIQDLTTLDREAAVTAIRARIKIGAVNRLLRTTVAPKSRSCIEGRTV